MTKPLVAVFAGAQAPTGWRGRRLQKMAEKLGQEVGEAGYDVIYGGGSRGLMGWMTNAAYKFGAQIEAVLLHRFEHDKEATPAKIVGVVDNEYERYPLMLAQNPEALFVLPGGSGTHREAWQGIEEAIYNHGAPVILVDSGRTLRGIKKDFNQAIKDGLIKPEFKNVLRTYNPDHTWLPGHKSLQEVLAIPRPTADAPKAGTPKP